MYVFRVACSSDMASMSTLPSVYACTHLIGGRAFAGTVIRSDGEIVDGYSRQLVNSIRCDIADSNFQL